MIGLDAFHRFRSPSLSVASAWITHSLTTAPPRLDWSNHLQRMVLQLPRRDAHDLCSGVVLDRSPGILLAEENGLVACDGIGRMIS